MRRALYSRWVAGATVLAICGVAHFLFRLTTAIVQYRDRNGNPFLFGSQFLSEMGMDGAKAQFDFNSGLLVLGLSLIPFFVLAQEVDSRDRVSLKLAAISGLFVSLGLVGLGAIPGNEGAHNAFLFMLAVSLPVTVLCYFVAVAGWKCHWRTALLRILAMGIVLWIAVLASLAEFQWLQLVAVAASLGWFPFLVCLVVKELRWRPASTRPSKPDDLSECMIRRRRSRQAVHCHVHWK